jgi:hypothetical protein
MEKAIQRITSAVNERRFLEHLRSFFSTSTTVLAECMQNARRAGATYVSFAYDASATTLIVMDDGAGIGDFAALVTVAESDWTPETMDNEQPFGIGFFSVCFAAERIRVESRGKRIEFSSDDLIAKTPITIQAGDFIDGTRITLLGCKLDEEKIASALTCYASGFPIPVIWQEIPLPRPCAQAGLVGEETSVGFIHVPGIHGDQELPSFADRGYVYCQGLPVFVRNFSYSYPPSHTRGYLVIHVDHLKYLPRMPDRDTLIDAQQALADMDNAIKRLWRAFMTEKKATMPALDFARTYWRVAVNAACLDLMNDVPVLPDIVLNRYTEIPTLADEYSTMRQADSVSRSDVESGNVSLFTCTGACGDAKDDFARFAWAVEEGVIFLKGVLPQGHWAEPYLRDLRSGEVNIDGQVLAEDRFDGNGCSANVKLVDQLKVTLESITHTIKAPFAMDHPVFGHTIHVPQSARASGHVLQQVSTYIDHDEVFQETDYEIDAQNFVDMIAILSGEPAHLTLQKCLDGVRAKRNLWGKRFKVEITQTGALVSEV